MNKTEMHDSTSNLCRVCSGRGEFDLFLPIPIFLHENLLEHIKWKRNISELISEITGLKIDKNDGLPQKICEICISYLKHAYSFREQTLNNTNSLLKALKISPAAKLSSIKPSESGGQQQQQHCGNNETVLNNLVKTTTNKSDNTNNNNNENNNDSNHQNNDKFFKNNFNLYNNLKSSLLANTAKINFVEYLSNKGGAVTKYNDVSQTKIAATSAISPPSSFDELDDEDAEESSATDTPELVYKERKCKYCMRRYMFKDTYVQHINECVERKLIIFIWELNYIHTNKENNQITSKQFIQKILMIFKENVILLVKYSNDFHFPDVIPKNGDDTNDAINRKLDNIIKFIDNNDKNNADSNPMGSSGSASSDTAAGGDVDSAAASSTSTPTSMYKIRCSNCDITFESLSCLEIHNFKYHNDNYDCVPSISSNNSNVPKSNNDFSNNDRDSSSINFNTITNEKLIELIEMDDNLVDVSSIFSGYFTNNNNNTSNSNNNKQKTDNNLTDKYKTLPCGKCGKRFLTIAHLDQHTLHKHTSNHSISYANLKLVPLPPPPTKYIAAVNRNGQFYVN